MKKGLTQQFTSYVKMQDVKALLDVTPSKYDVAVKKADVKPLTMAQAFTNSAKDTTYGSKAAELNVNIILDVVTQGAGATASLFSLGLDLMDNLSGADVFVENASELRTAFKVGVEMRDNATKTKTEMVKRVEKDVEGISTVLENETNVKADKKIGTVVQMQAQQRQARKMAFGFAA